MCRSKVKLRRKVLVVPQVTATKYGLSTTEIWQYDTMNAVLKNRTVHPLLQSVEMSHVRALDAARFGPEHVLVPGQLLLLNYCKNTTQETPPLS